MFKKPIKIGAQNQLSGKDRKTMRNKLVELFDEACVDKIMNVNDKIISCKTSGSKMVIYNGNDYPLFVDGTGKNDYFPSLYTAIAFQPLVKVVLLNEGVQSYIYNGANLMWPGVRDYSGLANFQKDQVVGIRTAKGQLVAIGAMGCSLKEFQANADKSGIAVYILHYFNDQLWAQGPKTKPQVLVVAEKPKPKQQKKEQQQKQSKKVEEKPKAQKADKKTKKQEQVQETKPQTKKAQQKTENKEKDKKGEKEKKNKKQSSQQKPKKKEQQEQQSDGQVDFTSLVHNKKAKPTHNQPIKVQKKGNQKTFSDDEDNDKKQKAKKKPAKKEQPKQQQKQQQKQQGKKKGKKQSDDEQKQQHSEGEEKKQVETKQQQQKSAVSSKLMDQQFKQAFLNALKLSKVQGELPIDSGRFYMDFMLLARPPGVKLQIKDTSYKKLGKFYQQMAKHKFIQFKHNKDKKGQPGSSIVKILWENEQLKNYEPTILRMNEKDVQQKQDHSQSKKKLKLNQTLEVQNVYKLHLNFKNAVYAKKVNYAPTQQQEQQMKKQEQQMKNLPQFYSQAQVRALIQKYINDKLIPKRDKDKKQKDDKEKKVQKMVTIDYKNNPYLAELLKKEIEEFMQNAQGDKQVDSDEEQQPKKSKKKKEHVMRMDRGALVNRIFKTCSASYHMRDKQNNIESLHEGTFKGIQLVAEKSNNKNITKIIGLQIFIVPKSQVEEQINGFANALKQKFACSVNIQNLPGKNAGKQIIVHGNFINQLEEMFTEEYKLNEDYIASQNKLDKKKKR